jgi:glycosyltransferase involved in cell wall biosynthesis
MKHAIVKELSENKSIKPLISVMIPVYNGAEYLEESVKSVIDSTALPIEIILVDDGSSDGSKALCRRLSRRYSNVRYLDYAVNQGMTRCLNTGILHARGEYIARINQDDLMQKNRLEKQLQFLENNPDHVAVGSFVELFTADNPKYDFIEFPTEDRDIKNLWMKFSPFADPTVMYRKSAWLKTKGYNQKMWPADDVHMWYQLGSIGKLANLPECLTRVRWHAAAGSVKSHRLQMQKTWEVHIWAAKHISQPKLTEVALWMGQFVAGKFFSAQFNWFVYRNIRRFMSGKKTLTGIMQFLAGQTGKLYQPAYRYLVTGK